MEKNYTMSKKELWHIARDTLKKGLKKVTWAVVLGGFAATMAFGKGTPQSQKYNVLFIPVDDLKPMLNCYGDKTVISDTTSQLPKSFHFFRMRYINIFPLCLCHAITIYFYHS